MASSSSHLPNILALLLLLFLSLSSLALSQRCHPNDEKALLQMKKDLNSPNFFSTWVPNTDCCKWSHIICDLTTKRVSDISLNDAKFNLPIPAAVGDVEFLRSLLIASCNVTGPIPQSLSKLSHLERLFLQENLLTGPVPSFLGNLKNMVYINLSWNYFTGSIPASLSQLSLLRDLQLNNNRLTGRIPESFGDFKETYFGLDLSYNMLSGPIPASLGRVDFITLDVERNRLSGDLSFLFAKNGSFGAGFFARNRFEFDMSKVEFPERMSSLDLSHNKIYGSLPKDMFRGRVLFNTLNVSYNRLCGPIPELLTVEQQAFDATVFSHNKCLCGKPLPKCS